MTDNVEEEDGQTPLEIVHTKRFKPTPSPVTSVEKEPGVVMVAGPVITDQEPVPTTGLFAEIVADVEHTDWEEPATEGSGGLLIVTVSVLEGYIHETPELKTLL